MRFGWCMACGKKARSVKASEEIYGRGLAWFSVVIVAGLIGGLISPESKAEALGGLDQRLNPDLLAQVFPGAQSFGAVEGQPTAAPVFQEGDLDGFLTTVGYVFSVGDILNPTGYTGQPFDITVGINLDGFVTGAVLHTHDEPMFRNTGFKMELEQTISGLAGIDVLAVPLDVPQNARLGDSSALVMLDSIYRAGREVAVSRELRGPGEREGRRLDIESYQQLDWESLRRMGAIRNVLLRNDHVAGALEVVGNTSPIALDEEGVVFADIYVALATPALIGRNLLGDSIYADKVQKQTKDGHFVLVAMNGHWVSSEEGAFPRGHIYNSLSRIRLRQDGLVITSKQLLVHEVEVAETANAPHFSWVSLLQVSEEVGFDGTRPWMLEFGIGVDGKEAVFGLPYVLPPSLVREPLHHLVAVSESRQIDVPPLWVTVWLNQKVAIGILVFSLIALSVMLVLQAEMARFPKMLAWFRTGFLVFTLVWIGWYAGAQLSVMHLLSLIQAPFREWSLSSLLLDPLTVIVMAFSALGLIMLGRGVFCGWLCPFGALQELLSKVARRLKVPQTRIPHKLNERLWALKYAILITLVGISFFDAPHLANAVEVEPFTTAILFGFARSWPFTIFAISILGVGLFVERFFCRYMCPLGAGLAIVGRWRMLEWFKRRTECGNSCQTCRGLCPVQAIGTNGTINLNECYHCLSCQVAFYDDQICPPLMARRERRERALGGGIKDPNSESSAVAY
mgnify:CR=1 FL=1